MKIRHARIVSASVFASLAVATPLPAEEGGTTRPGAPAGDDRLTSVLVRAQDLFAATRQGLYRSTTAEKNWTPLPIGDSLPTGGFFATQPATSKSVFYFASRIDVRTAEANAGPPGSPRKTFGLHRSDDDGRTWHLVSAELDFTMVYVHEDGTLFAFAPPKESARADADTVLDDFRNTIWMSTDAGKQWRDISDGTNLQPVQIFPDPDHPGLVCIVGNSIRNYVLQATDKSYRWKRTREWEWDREHESDDRFFSRNYSTTWFLPLFHATLSNFFNHPFNGSTELPAFRIVTDDTYRLKKGEWVIIPVELRYLSERETETVNLPDMDRDMRFWAIHRILPDGRRETISNTGAGNWSKEGIRSSRAFRVVTLDKDTPYKRTLDLSSRCDFHKAGTYRVLLVYDSSWIADREQKEWPGSFSSNVFNIHISE